MPQRATSIWRDAIDLFICFAGIFISYSVYGIIHEKLFRKGQYGPDRFGSSFFLVAFQSLANALVAWILMKVLPAEKTDKEKPRVPPLPYIKIAASYAFGMIFTNYAMGYVSYITQVLGKSCKMIPVMVMRIFTVGQTYSLSEYIHVLLLTAGIVVFTIGEGKSSSATTSALGLALLLFSLVLDGYTGPSQEGIIKKYNPPQQELALNLNLYAVIIVFVASLVTGDFFSAVNFISTYPAVVPDLLLFAFLSAVGQNFILYTVFRFNSLTATIITTIRKFFSIVLSCVWFGNNLSTVQWTGVVLVFLSLGLNIQYKYAEKKGHISKDKDKDKQKPKTKTTKSQDGTEITEVFPNKKED